MISPREQQILDRADAGTPAEAIAEELDLALSYVRQVIGFFSGDPLGRHERAMKAGSQALLRAVTAALAEVRA